MNGENLLKKKKLKIIPICAIVLLFIPTFGTLFSNGLSIYDRNADYYAEKNHFPTFTQMDSNSMVSIKNIKGGFGLNLDIINEGDQDIQNIQLYRMFLIKQRRLMIL